MDNGNTANVVYLGLAKVFDSVSYMHLLTKIELFGLCKKSSNGSDPIWREEPTVAYALSRETRIKVGVLQGLVIWKLLFSLFVKNLPSIISVSTLLFADSAKVFLPWPFA